MSDAETLFCTFEVSGRLFGIPILDIKEVTDEIEYTRVPHAPQVVGGYVNIRGHIILGLDLKQMLGLTGTSQQRARRLVIFKPHVGQAFGLLVDDVGEITAVSNREVDASSAEKLGFKSTGRGELVERVCKLDDRLLIVLNPRRFLPLVEATGER